MLASTVSTIYPVSYTHLDVYKRQVLSAVYIRWCLSLAFGNLLIEYWIHALKQSVNVIMVGKNNVSHIIIQDLNFTTLNFIC